MDNTVTCSLINGLLIEVHRSLLQYSREAAAWSPAADEELITQLDSLAQEQEKSVNSMVDFLQARKHLIDFGVFPHEYTSLHFVSIDYLIGRIQESEQTLVSELENSISLLAGDLDAVHLVESVLEREKAIIKTLDELTIASA